MRLQQELDVAYCAGSRIGVANTPTAESASPGVVNPDRDVRLLYGNLSSPCGGPHADGPAPAARCASTCLVTEETTALDPDALENKYYKPGVGVILEVKPRGPVTGRS